MVRTRKKGRIFAAAVDEHWRAKPRNFFFSPAPDAHKLNVYEAVITSFPYSLRTVINLRAYMRCAIRKRVRTAADGE